MCEFCTNHLLTEDKFYNWEYYNPLMKRWFYLQDRLIDIEGKKARLEIATDISKNVALNNELVSKLEEQEAINACIETLHSNLSPQKCINNLLKVVANYFKADRAYIFEIDKEKIVMNNTYEWCNKNVVSQIDILKNISMKSFDRWIEKYDEIGEFFIEDIESLDKTKDEYQTLKAQGITSLVTAPLRDNDGNLYGFIGVDNPSKNIDNTKLMRATAKFVSEFFDKYEIFEKLNDLSFKDMLTGLKNRHSYRLALNEFEVKPPNTLGIIYVDIIGLKSLNDVYGYLFGDKVVLKLCEILKKYFSDSIFRLSGDEFVVLSTDVSEDEFSEKVSLFRAETLEYKELNISISSSWNKREESILGILEPQNAIDNINKNRAFLPDKKKYNSMLYQNLKKEIDDGRFVVFLQPQVDLETGSVCSAEALIRRVGPSGSLESPQGFISFYEKEGIISILDYFVFKTACQVLSKWKKDYDRHDIKIAVNLSRLTVVDKDILPKLKGFCDYYGVLTSQVILEVTETLDNVENEVLSKILEGLSKEGFLISLDDFGSGQSNLAIMTTSNFDEIKLDKSLIDGLGTNDKSEIIIKLAIDACFNLDNTHSVAEGIEKKEQFEILKQMKCKKGQGYYFSKPIPIEEFSEKYIL